MATSKTVTATQNTGLSNRIVENRNPNEVLNDQTNLISAETVATIRDTTAPVVTKTADLFLFNKVEMNLPITVATIKENSQSNTWLNWGVSFVARVISDNSLDNYWRIEENPGGIRANLVGDPTSTSGAQVQVTGKINWTDTQVTNSTYFTRGAFVRDAEGNKGVSADIRIRVLHVPNGFINKQIGQAATADEIRAKAQSLIQGDYSAAGLQIVSNGTPPAVNVSDIARLTVRTSQGIEAPANIFVNYPPTYSAPKDMYVFRGTDASTTSVSTQVLTITDVAKELRPGG